MASDARETAWLLYQDDLGNKTQREEDQIERAFKIGWSAAQTKRTTEMEKLLQRIVRGAREFPTDMSMLGGVALAIADKSRALGVTE